MLSSSQWTERYDEELWDEEIDPEKYQSDERRQYALSNGLLRIEHRTAECWKTIMQMPYDAGLHLENISKQIENDLFDGGVLEEIGCPERVSGNQNGQYHDFGDKNGIYRWRYKADFRTGFWNIEIYTTHDISVARSRRI